MSHGAPDVPDTGANGDSSTTSTRGEPSVERLMMLPVPEAPYIANTLGLLPEFPSNMDEDQRRQFIEQGVIPRLKLERPEKVDAIYSRFCVKYLVSLIDRSNSPPRDAFFKRCTGSVLTSYMAFILQLQWNPYFVKLMLEPTHLAATISAGMVEFTAHRLINDIEVLEGRINSYAEPRNFEIIWTPLIDVVELFAVLLAFQYARGNLRPLIPSMKSHLLERLRWARNTRRQAGASGVSSFERAAEFLEASPEAVERAIRISSAREGLETCCRPGCRARYDLMLCSRCQTVVYCSRKHQSEHWRDPTRPHKFFCHKTDWKIAENGLADS